MARSTSVPTPEELAAATVASAARTASRGNEDYFEEITNPYPSWFKKDGAPVIVGLTGGPFYRADGSRYFTSVYGVGYLDPATDLDRLPSDVTRKIANGEVRLYPAGTPVPIDGFLTRSLVASLWGRRIPSDPDDTTSPGSLEALQELLTSGALQGVRFQDNTDRSDTLVTEHLEKRVAFIQRARAYTKEQRGKAKSAQPANAPGVTRFL